MSTEHGAPSSRRGPRTTHRGALHVVEEPPRGGHRSPHRPKATVGLKPLPDESHIGSSFVGRGGMLLLIAIVVGGLAFLLEGLAAFWPAEPSSAPRAVHFVGLHIEAFSTEQRLFVIVLMTGALGGLLHSIRSLAWYIGNRKLKWSWAPMYVLLPFSSAVLALIFYFVLRAGFLSPEAMEKTSTFSIAALGSLVGLFSEAAILKLKAVAETVFTAPTKGSDQAISEEAPEGSPPQEGEPDASRHDRTSRIAPT